jgi:hypothetical protein
VFTLTIKPDGGEPYEVEATTRDVLVWEKAGQNRSMSRLVNDMRIADVYQVAHIAARRLQLFTGSLKDFEETCDLDIRKILTDDDDEEESGGDEDPTQSGP